jgi:hypothetical protein
MPAGAALTGKMTAATWLLPGEGRKPPQVRRAEPAVEGGRGLGRGHQDGRAGPRLQRRESRRDRGGTAGREEGVLAGLARQRGWCAWPGRGPGDGVPIIPRTLAVH